MVFNFAAAKVAKSSEFGVLSSGFCVYRMYKKRKKSLTSSLRQGQMTSRHYKIRIGLNGLSRSCV